MNCHSASTFQVDFSVFKSVQTSLRSARRIIAEGGTGGCGGGHTASADGADSVHHGARCSRAASLTLHTNKCPAWPTWWWSLCSGSWSPASSAARAALILIHAADGVRHDVRLGVHHGGRCLSAALLRVWNRVGFDPDCVRGAGGSGGARPPRRGVERCPACVRRFECWVVRPRAFAQPMLQPLPFASGLDVMARFETHPRIAVGLCAARSDGPDVVEDIAASLAAFVG